MIIENMEVVVRGRFPRVARLEAEYYEWVDDPRTFLEKVVAHNMPADVFTFLQGVNDITPSRNFHCEPDSIAVLRLSTFDEWWTKQINVKTRNMIRKAQKSGVDVRVVPFDEVLIKGIKEIYDEAPLRQGKPFKHYQKDLETLKNDHISFLDRSTFIGAFCAEEIIGFAKLVHGRGISNVMQIISKIAHRDKAPTNALLAKAVEICAARRDPYLHYGVWSKRGLGDFKKHHAFERLDLCRNYIPLNTRGKLILKLQLHRRFSERLPDRYVDFLVALRSRWNTFRTTRRVWWLMSRGTAQHNAGKEV